MTTAWTACGGRAVTRDMADGWFRDSTSASVRYPVSFLGQRRCVLLV